MPSFSNVSSSSGSTSSRLFLLGLRLRRRVVADRLVVDRRERRPSPSAARPLRRPCGSRHGTPCRRHSSMNSGSSFLCEMRRMTSSLRPGGATSDSMSVTKPHLYSERSSTSRDASVDSAMTYSCGPASGARERLAEYLIVARGAGSRVFEVGAREPAEERLAAAHEIGERHCRRAPSRACR